MRKLLILSFILACFASFSQGIRPDQFKGAPNKNDIFKAVTPYWDPIARDTFYRFVYAPQTPDSLFINGDWYYSGDTVTIDDEYSFLEELGPSGHYWKINMKAFGGSPEIPVTVYLDNSLNGVYLDPYVFPDTYVMRFQEGDDDPDNEHGILRRSNDSLFYKTGDFEPDLFITKIDTSNINEYGNISISNDSLYYRQCPTCSYTFISKIDTSNTNEKQIFILSGDNTVRLSNGGGMFSIMGIGGITVGDFGGAFQIAADDPTPTNERGTVRISGDSLFYTKGDVYSEEFIGIVGGEVISVDDTPTIDIDKTGTVVSAEVIDSSITPAKLDRAYASPDTIYILATGQSNAGYRGLDSPSPQSNVQTWNGSAWATAVVDTNSHIGFEFAKLMGQRYPKKIIRYIHVYRDGNFIQTWYNGGVNYNDIVTYSNAAGVPHYDYMLWMQGEANASTASKQVYESMFDTVLTDLAVNSWFGDETDIIVKSLSYDYTYSGPERFFEELNFRNDINIRFVNTIDLGDGIHVNGTEINEVARRMFNSVDKTELNPKVWEHNPLTHVVVTSDSTDYVGVKKLGVNSFQNTYDFNVEGRAYINRGTQNLFISGGNDTYSNATGRNVGIGFQTLTNINNSAFSNTAIGANAGFSLTSGTNNTLIGKGSGFSLLGGTDNVMIGSDVGLNTSSGSNNLFIGSNAGYFNTTGTGNVGMGALALRANINQPYNSAYGFYSSFGATGQLNSSFGAFARQNGGSGNLTTAIGAYSGFNYTGSGGVLIGYQGGYNETGDNKLVIENSSSTTGLIVGDFANDRAGVNKTTAGLGATLHVGGTFIVDNPTGTPDKIGAWTTGNQATKFNIGDGLYLSGSDLRAEKYWTRSGSNVYLTNTGDRVGLNGVTSPTAFLHMNGNVGGVDMLRFERSSVKALYTDLNLHTYLKTLKFGNLNKSVGNYTPGVEISEFSDVLINADKKYTVTTASIGFNSNLFANLPSGAHWNIPSGQNDTMYINFIAKGAYTSNGIIYTQGQVYVVFYSTLATSNVGCQWKNRDGVWTNVTSSKVIDTYQTGYKYAVFTIGPSNYLTELKVYVTADEGNNAWVSQLRYIPTAESVEGSYIQNYGSTANTYNSLYFRDNSYVTKILLNRSGSSYFNSGSVGIGNTSPTATLDITGDLKVSTRTGSPNRLAAWTALGVATEATFGPGFAWSGTNLTFTETYTGTVSNIATINGITGGPITSTGSIGLTGQALAIHNLGANGIVSRTGTGTFSARTITAGTGINVSNGDGVSGNPTITNTLPENTSVTDGTTIDFTETGDNITGEVKDGSITPVKLDRTYVTSNIYTSDGTIPATTFREVMISAGSDLYFTDPGNGLNFQLNDHLLAAQINDGAGSYSTHVMTTSYNRLGFDTDNFINFNETGATLSLNGSTGTSGYVLKSGGSGSMYWDALTGSGTVTSIATNNGITGGTITTSGTIGLTGQALALHNLASNGIISRTGSGTVAARTITAGTGISISNGDGVSGNPTITNTGDTNAADDMLLFNGLSSADYNTLTTNGVYRATGATNGPSGASHSTLFTAMQSGNYGWQLAGIGNDAFYMRWENGGSWGSWSQLASRSWASSNFVTANLATSNLTQTGTTRVYTIAASGSLNFSSSTGDAQIGIGNAGGEYITADVSSGAHYSTLEMRPTYAQFGYDGNNIIRADDNGVKIQLNGSYGTSGNSLISGGSGTMTWGTPAIQQVNGYSTSSTWTKPTGCKTVTVTVIGGGGGGGGGSYIDNSTHNSGSGGGGGGAGGRSQETFDCSTITSTVTITVGSGGSGGPAQSSLPANGNSGSNGGQSSFGSYLKANGGGGGQGGQLSATSNGGTAGLGSSCDGGAGGGSTNTATSGTTGEAARFASGGGNGGAGVTTSSGGSNTTVTPPLLGTTGSTTLLGSGGTGAAAANTGGSAGNYGGGGGGGGAGRSATHIQGGAGAAGAGGYVQVITNF